MNRRHRLRSHRRVVEVHRAGVAATVPPVRARAQRNNAGVARLAIAVQGTRSAVERNRARRRVRAALAAVAPSLPAVDVVVTVPVHVIRLRALPLIAAITGAVSAAAQRCEAGA